MLREFAEMENIVSLFINLFLQCLYGFHWFSSLHLYKCQRIHITYIIVSSICAEDNLTPFQTFYYYLLSYLVINRCVRFSAEDEDHNYGIDSILLVCFCCVESRYFIAKNNADLLNSNIKTWESWLKHGLL